MSAQPEPRFVNDFHPGVALAKLLASVDPKPTDAPAALRVCMQRPDGLTYMAVELTEVGAELVAGLLEAEEDRQRVAGPPAVRTLRVLEGGEQ
ncbi:hypothetical protein [Streptomyces africanus]|uniref:hypothetical protein n=1 Tax=Streptomyces africanus TaxID=231024 RepID=UPI000A3B712D|nr:hypothetical protein [Streptomyces africanus]